MARVLTDEAAILARALTDHYKEVEQVCIKTADRLLADYCAILALFRLHNHSIHICGRHGMRGLRVVKIKGKSRFYDSLYASLYASAMADRMGDRFPVAQVLGHIETSLRDEIAIHLDGEYLNKEARVEKD